MRDLLRRLSSRGGRERVGVSRRKQNSSDTAHAKPSETSGESSPGPSRPLPWLSSIPCARIVQLPSPSRIPRHLVLRARLEANVGALCIARVSGGNRGEIVRGGINQTGISRKCHALCKPFSQVPISCPRTLIKRNIPIDALSFRWLFAPSIPRPNHTPLKTIGPDLP